ncbi:hypothetical protein BJG93_30555 (plasmid) [Paraburkholderia sprentiae WSM5005]|uniref:Uncharacterized protein n=1 Tax=Paraburkholderia sprentiae WSM5005 TaxID=754502 RepID=A0A1I9YUA9_9BURK|nr:hypothetical protein [Paraburkholderia sprentiae]APA89803.1 hypothetical protein BJG93_30555 [Paraburkholderia sprentiae WSM5005]
MSMKLASFYRRAVFGSFEAVRQRVDRDRRPAAVRARNAHAGSRDDPERLERIATYARAGYFNMGYTLESFHVIAEITPD